MFRNNKTVLIVCITLTCFVLSAGSVNLKTLAELIPEDEQEGSTEEYNTVSVHSDNYLSEITASGSVYVPVQRTVLYEGSNAYYVETLVSLYDVVEKGDPLIALYVETDEVQIVELEMRLSRLQEDYSSTLLKYDLKIQELWEDYYQCSSTYEQERCGIEIKKNQVEKERLIYEQDRAVREMEEELQKLYDSREMQYITAPVSGTIYDLKSFKQDDVIQNHEEIATIADISSALIRVSSDRLNIGTAVTVETSLSSQKLEFPGTVKISSMAIPDTLKVFTLISVDLSSINRFSSMKGGFNEVILSIGKSTLTVEGISVSLPGVQTLPSSAKIEDDDGTYVYVIEDGIPHKRLIQVGASNKSSFWILQGLNEGEQVILN